MLRLTDELTTLFDRPRVFFTRRGNPKSAQVLAELQKQLRALKHDQECTVFDEDADVQRLFRSGVSPSSAVALMDDSICKRCTPTTRSRADNNMPTWTYGAQWGVRVGAKFKDGNPKHAEHVAQQMTAWFERHFDDQLNRHQFPWGAPRRGDRPPRNVQLPDSVFHTLDRLNQGPDLAQAIAHLECAVELPQGSRISWRRVPPDPLVCDAAEAVAILESFGAFEALAGTLLTEHPEVRELLLAGVDIHPDLVDIYCSPRAKTFSVRRPDLHWTGQQRGVFASENDEMPGGFAELVFLDHAYGLNAERWKRCFSWLTAEGPLLILVSHEWSKCYITELSWLTAFLEQAGYPVLLRQTDRMEDVTVTSDGVFVEGRRIGTIWRQFPIFEARDQLVPFIRAAHEGRVRMVPEFAHFGNKTWFSLFRSYGHWFRDHMDAETFSRLDALLPHSHLVRSASDFPCTIANMTIQSLKHLSDLHERDRDSLVLKLSGANALTSRSYGVLMGHGLSQETWRTWIAERMQARQPFIVQQRVETDVARIPVLDTRFRSGEVFNCRVLLRPWMVGGELVSVHTCAVPANTLRVHGRVDMAVAPVRLV